MLAAAPDSRAETAALLGGGRPVARERQADRARGHDRLGRAGGGRAVRDLRRRAAVRAADRPPRPVAGAAGGGAAGPAAARRRIGVAFAGRARLPGRERNRRPQPERRARDRRRSRAGVARLGRAGDRCPLRLRRSAERSRRAIPRCPRNFSAAALSGKAECRRAIARRCSLALGPRTLLLTTGPAASRRRADAILGGHRTAGPFDVATIIVPRGEPEVGRARAAARAQAARPRRAVPGRRGGDERLARGAADAILLGDDHDRIGRAAGLALLYGTLPIAPEVGSEPRLPGRLRRGLANRPRDPVRDRDAVRDRKRRPTRADLACGRRRLDAAGQDADGERAPLVGGRRRVAEIAAQYLDGRPRPDGASQPPVAVIGSRCA